MANAGKTENWIQLLLLGGRSEAEVTLIRTGSNLIRNRKQTGSVAGMMFTGTESKRSNSLLSPPALWSPSGTLSWQSLTGAAGKAEVSFAESQRQCPRVE